MKEDKKINIEYKYNSLIKENICPITEENIYPITEAIYFKGKNNKKIDSGFIWIQCPFCEQYKREHKLLITESKVNYCNKCKEFSAIYKIHWGEEVKKKNIVHTITLFSWQPKTYRKKDIKEILKQKGTIVGLFKIKEKKEYDDYQIKYKTEKEIREDERRKVLKQIKEGKLGILLGKEGFRNGD